MSVEECIGQGKISDQEIVDVDVSYIQYFIKYIPI